MDKNKVLNQLTPDFILELFANILYSERMFESVNPHLEFQFLPTNSHKQIFQYCRNFYELNNQLPTYGIIIETYKTNSEIISLLAQIKAVDIHNKDNHDQLLDKLQDFLKTVKFLELHKRTKNLWDEGKEIEAIAVMAEVSKQISEFSIKQKYIKGVFADYEKRQLARESRGENNVFDKKVTFGIHELNHYTRFGGKLGTSTLLLAASGVGKTTALRWFGVSAALIGKRVVHFQSEGSEEDCFDGYDAAWTGQKMFDLEMGLRPIPKPKEEDSFFTAKQITSWGGEIHVVASEQFDSMTIESCRAKVIEIEKLYGKVDLVLYDYLELFTLASERSDGSQYAERSKRDKLGKKITDMAVELNHHAIAATQSNSIPAECWTDPTKVLTRENIAEHKGLVRHFATFLTLNQTHDEKNNGIMRIHIDKLRKYRGGQTITIYQNADAGRFYDAASTLETFWNDQTKQRKMSDVVTND